MVNNKVMGGLFGLFMVVILAVTIICLIAKYGYREEAEARDWWRDSVVYQVYPRSLHDHRPLDGTGDVPGITQKVEYLHELGVGTVWLSPIFTSPMADFGYDVSNFTDVDPIFGTLKDLDELTRALHNRGMKIVLDFVPNHSSDEHEWFVKSRQKVEPYTDYYVWADPKGYDDAGKPLPPNNWVSVFKGSAWKWVEERQQFYLHQFLAKQPDLNFRNPAVREEMKNVLKFWLDRGVDGFRIDAIKHLFEVEDLSQDEPVATDSATDDPTDYAYLNHTCTMNQPETFGVVKEWRDLMDQYPDKLMMVEVFDGDIDEIMRYYGNETVPLADFPFNFLMIENFRNRSDLSGFSLKDTIDMWMDNMPEGKWPNWVLGNHDRGRVGSRFGADLVDGLNMVNLLLPGTPVTYYGEEIGMLDTWISWEDTQDPSGCNYGPEHYHEHSRDPERTPMQWDNSSFAGFTTGNTTWLPVNDNYGRVNVAAQEAREESHLKVYRELAHLRREEPFRTGHTSYPVITTDVFTLLRHLEGHERYLLVVNTSEEEVEVDLHHHANMELPHTAIVITRSTHDTSPTTSPGSEVKLSELRLLSGEGLLLNLVEEE